MKKESLLASWLKGENPLHAVNLVNLPVVKEYGGFLSLDVVVPVHESGNLKAESLSNSWISNKTYIDSIFQFFGENLCVSDTIPIWLEDDNADLIINTLGTPPPFCYPVYIISLGDNNNEEIAYIGRTSSNNGRFRGGHAAFTKLLNPAFDKLSKRIYLGTIGLRATNHAYTPLELVQPQKLATQILSSIESQLIYHFKPRLNSHHVNKYNGTWPVLLSIENNTGLTSFLDGSYCCPPMFDIDKHYGALDKPPSSCM